MSPFYERETGRELKRGEIFELRNKGPVDPTLVEIWDDDHALVIPPKGHRVYLRKHNKEYSIFVDGRVMATKESISNNSRGTGGVEWREK